MKKYLINENKLLNKKHFFISDYFTVTDGEHGTVEYLENGVKYLTAENIKNGFIDISNIRYVSEDVDKRNKRASVNGGDILISIKGTLGQIAVAESWLKPANMNRDVAIMKPKKQIIGLSEYLAIFMMSSTGEIQSSRGGSGGVQQMITLERLRKFIIPSLSENFYKNIKNKYDLGLQKLEQSKSLYSQAEKLLLDELGLSNMLIKRAEKAENPLGFSNPCDNISIKKFSDFAQSGRLDAEYYQKKYDEIEKKISEMPNVKIAEIGKICDQNFTPLGNVKYKYIELADIGTAGEVTGCTVAIGSELPTRARRIIHAGDILISSIEGSLQSCAIVPKEFDNALCSTGFYVMTPSKLNAESFLILLKSEIIQALLKKGCSGTILTNISKDEFLKIKIPILPQAVQTQIASLIQESFDCKAESKQLLETAKKLVEDEIER